MSGGGEQRSGRQVGAAGGPGREQLAGDASGDSAWSAALSNWQAVKPAQRREQTCTCLVHCVPCASTPTPRRWALVAVSCNGELWMLQ
jgi:hypothetical protein